MPTIASLPRTIQWRTLMVCVFVSSTMLYSSFVWFVVVVAVAAAIHLCSDRVYMLSAHGTYTHASHVWLHAHAQHSPAVALPGARCLCVCIGIPLCAHQSCARFLFIHMNNCNKLSQIIEMLHCLCEKSNVMPRMWTSTFCLMPKAGKTTYVCNDNGGKWVVSIKNHVYTYVVLPQCTENSAMLCNLHMYSQLQRSSERLVLSDVSWMHRLVLKLLFILRSAPSNCAAQLSTAFRTH